MYVEYRSLVAILEILRPQKNIHDVYNILGNTGATSTLCYAVLSALCFINRERISSEHDVSLYIFLLYIYRINRAIMDSANAFPKY